MIALLLQGISIKLFSQENNLGQISGSFQLDGQFYQKDSLIGAPAVPEKIGVIAYTQLFYTRGNFEAGLRYESYLTPLQGYDPRFKGSGFGNRYVKYTVKELEITAGNFYEQYGSGLILRTYNDWGLGYDNAFDGVKIRYNPYKGLVLKGLVGNQRNFWDKGNGIVRGFDGEIYINDLHEKLSNLKTRVIAGGSFVSKFQRDQDPIYKLPENVGSYSGRLDITYGKINIFTEYANKINDPSAINGYIYKPGNALLIKTSYSQKGLGISLGAKRIDNMSFRSDRTATGNSLNINYLPALTRQHVYNLASVYPYGTQEKGEIGFQGTMIYALKKNTKLGGKYGTGITINYSRANAIDKSQIHDTIPIGTKGTLGYNSNFFKMGKKVYFEDFNIEISRKINRNLTAIVTYVNIAYDIETVQGHIGAPKVYSQVFITDVSYRLKSTTTIRGELQHLRTHQDKGDWAMAMFEYTTKKWFAAITDMYNYGNEDKNLQIHYYTASIGFFKNTNRFMLSYGKQREGIMCVGGVCRTVPASNGLTLTITSSF